MKDLYRGAPYGQVLTRSRIEWLKFIRSVNQQASYSEAVATFARWLAKGVVRREA